MFSFFKKRIHEPEEKQRAELLEWVERTGDDSFVTAALAGADCDELAGGSGPFGHSHTNPIPTNGVLGTYKYLGKLISASNGIVYFHRLGSLPTFVSRQPVDAYELVDWNGQNWDVLFVDMYHPRRSVKVPSGYRFKEYDRKYGDLPFAFGVNSFCPGFPYDLPEELDRRYGEAFGRRVRARLAAGEFHRPLGHGERIQGVRAMLTGGGGR